MQKFTINAALEEATDFKSDEGTIIVDLSDRQIKCSKYILRQRCPYLKQILDIATDASIGIEEKNTNKAIEFLREIHNLRLHEILWDADFAALAAKWEVADYIIHYRDCIEKTINSVKNKKSGMNSKCLPTIDLADGWYAGEFAAPGQVLPTEPVQVVYNNEIGRIKNLKSTSGSDNWCVTFESRFIAENFPGEVTRVKYKLPCSPQRFPGELYKAASFASSDMQLYPHRPELLSISTSEAFWEAVNLALTHDVYAVDGMSCKDDLLKMLRDFPQLLAVDEELMSSLFSDGERRILKSLLKVEDKLRPPRRTEMR